MASTFEGGNDADIKKMLSTMGADAGMNHGDFAYYFADIFVASV